MMTHSPLAKPASRARPAPAPSAAPATEGRPMQHADRASSPCACGGGCPRCGTGPVIQRHADPSPPPGFEPDRDELPAPNGDPGFDDAVQAASDGAAASPARGPVQAAQVASSLGSGSALAPPAQSAMNRFFGQDLGHVRVHADGGANALATSLHAHAFTVGHQIAFASGHYRPDHPEGQSLIAHELTHVLQQRQGLDSDIQRAGIGSQGDRYEVEAESNAERFRQGRQASSISAGSTGTGATSASGGPGALQLYSASNAVAYARKWATSTNPAYPRDGNDCTNFVSQAVYAGGWAMAGGSCDDRKDNGAWWYGDSQCWYPGVHRSYTWGGAQNFYNFTNGSGRATAASKISDLGLGDVLQVAHDGHVGHTTMVTGKTDDNLLLSYHTSDTLDLPVWGKGGFLDKYASSSTPTTFYAWKM